MKVLLINSPIYNKKVADEEDFLPPLGLGYIATQLHNDDIEAKIIDCVFENLTTNEILKIIELEKPNFIGINIFSVNFELVKEIIEQTKINTSFIVGGKITKFIYDDIINMNTMNSINVVIGEGDLITTDIVKKNLKENPILCQYNRVVYEVSEKSIYFPKNISDLKLDRRIFEDRTILNKYNKKEQPIITSRECLYNCAFCGGARSLNKNIPVRERNEISIIEELMDIQDIIPDTESIRVLDDLFLKNRKSIEKAISIFKKFNFEWRGMAHVKSLQNSEDLFQMLKESGCRELEIGIESGNEKIRNIIHKEGTVKEVYDIITKILDAGINVKGYVMYGFPNETPEQCYDTYMLVKKIHEYSLNSSGKFKPSAFQFRPYHGTELYNKIGQEISYKHNDDLDNLVKRKQFNFTAGNFSACTNEQLNKFIIETSKLEEEDYVRTNKKM